nr:conjugal transfer protein TraX [[Clostridium] innocuum]
MLYASLSLPLLSCYNGKKGALPKWLFYTFYPLHITILVVLYITA